MKHVIAELLIYLLNQLPELFLFEAQKYLYVNLVSPIG